MPRPSKKKQVSSLPLYSCFTHTNQLSENNFIKMSIEEFETIRLIDYFGKQQQECAEMMEISRASVQILYDAARKKIGRFLVEGRPLFIDGGNYQLNLKQTLGDDKMKIAVPYENGQVFQHFGHSSMFKMYEVSENKVISSELVDTNGNGHGALVGFLKEHQVDVLICGGIGAGAKNALSEANITLYGGACGNADEQVTSFLQGNLQYNPNIQCSHHNHGEGHSCGNHSCKTN
ncbi:NifB/NifX family molybdenum-iron cluster-binding protein [Erysipelotrichaceae bacterium HCN-30851]